MSSEEMWDKVKFHLNESGFNIVVRINSGEYDRVAPESKRAESLLNNARSIILAGFAGNKFWPLLQSYSRQNPEFSNRDENLIDNYTKLKLEQITETSINPNESAFKITYPFGEGAYDLDFTMLGMMGGVGVPSLLGILLNPQYGTWMSLRAAIVTDIGFAEYDKPISEFNPCPSCEKPCIDACPANTVSVTGWDWKSCMDFRLSSDVCSLSCASRISCPYGKSHIYPDEQIQYHHRFVLKTVKSYYKAKSF